MFVPEHFKFEERAALLAFIETYSFGVLITHTSSKYVATHLPFIVNAKENCLYAHLARANPQVQALQACESALAVFSGEHAYVSPRWYVSKNNVPTWNYSAVHVTLNPSMLDQAGTVNVVDALAAVNESGFPQPWSSDLVEPRQLDALHRGIVGFRFVIDSMQGKRKLSQNKGLEDRRSVIRGLEERAFGLGVARDMRLSEEALSDDSGNE